MTTYTATAPGVHLVIQRENASEARQLARVMALAMADAIRGQEIAVMTDDPDAQGWTSMKRIDKKE